MNGFSCRQHGINQPHNYQVFSDYPDCRIGSSVTVFFFQRYSLAFLCHSHPRRLSPFTFTITFSHSICIITWKIRSFELVSQKVGFKGAPVEASSVLKSGWQSLPWLNVYCSLSSGTIKNFRWENKIFTN